MKRAVFLVLLMFSHSSFPLIAKAEADKKVSYTCQRGSENADLRVPDRENRGNLWIEVSYNYIEQSYYFQLVKMERGMRGPGGPRDVPVATLLYREPVKISYDEETSDTVISGRNNEIRYYWDNSYVNKYGQTVYPAFHKYKTKTGIFSESLQCVLNR